MADDTPPISDRPKRARRVAGAPNVKKIKARVRALLASGDEGKQQALKDIREGLLTAMYLEQAAGEHPQNAGRSTEANARQSRRQFKELAELVMEVLDEDR